ncbi:MAG: DNA recombination protein RmuC, partial [Ilumatobacteraceae bacterium]|nr:DNA recombination protein RmuC [Ilumatobacteraceae bacterium]
ISNQARHDREESIRMATDLITKASNDQLGARADVINSTMLGVKSEVAGQLKKIDDALNTLRESSATQYGNMEQAVSVLSKRTENLNDVLSSSQARGQWGERLAEDMLRKAGFIEGINYEKQEIINGGGKPDYTFKMPPDRVLYMDVKFPLDKYAEYINAESEALKVQARLAFLAAVKGHVDTLAKRDYVDKSNDNTIDYVLMFVPNESISGFVHEASPSLIDDALDRKVVLCSPLTLYAFLVVIRQAADSFHTEQTAATIMQRVNQFGKEFEKYTGAVDQVSKSYAKLQDELESISTGGTRFKKLNVPVREIEKLRKNQGIPELEAGQLSIEDDLQD